MIIQLIHTDILKPDVLRQQTNDLKVCMEIVFGSGDHSLINDVFQKVDVPYKTASENKNKFFLCIKGVIEILCVKLKIANDNDVLRPYLNERIVTLLQIHSTQKSLNS